MTLRIASIEPAVLEIPFKVAFRHASAERRAMQSLLVTARDTEGHEGRGEGCPREYVTAESLASAEAFVRAHRDDWMRSIDGPESLALWAAGHREIVDANPAAWCAVELALLDLLARARGDTIEGLLGLPAIEGRFRYTAVLGDSGAEGFARQLRGYLEAGFHDFKVKLSGDRERDLAKARALREAGVSPQSVRADANNLWRSAESANEHLAALEYPFFAIEEPLAPRDHAGMRQVARARDALVILDESATGVRDLAPLREDAHRWIVNVRVSKMGGLARSLDVVRLARQTGLLVVVGAHVGETSLLTRAALPVAQAARGILVGQEGAFGTHLLERDLVDPPLMFGAGGLLDAARLR